jgi:hypothetical protein
MTHARPHHSVVLEDLGQAAARYRLNAHDSGTLVASRWLVFLGEYTKDAAAIVAIPRACRSSNLKLF